MNHEEGTKPTGKVHAKNHPEYTKYTIFTVLVPIVGLLLGVTYSAKDDPQDKKLGEHLLAFSILLSILYAVLYVFFFAGYVII